MVATPAHPGKQEDDGPKAHARRLRHLSQPRRSFAPDERAREPFRARPPPKRRQPTRPAAGEELAARPPAGVTSLCWHGEVAAVQAHVEGVRVEWDKQMAVAAHLTELLVRFSSWLRSHVAFECVVYQCVCFLCACMQAGAAHKDCTVRCCLTAGDGLCNRWPGRWQSSRASRTTSPWRTGVRHHRVGKMCRRSLPPRAGLAIHQQELPTCVVSGAPDPNDRTRGAEHEPPAGLSKLQQLQWKAAQKRQKAAQKASTNPYAPGGKAAAQAQAQAQAQPSDGDSGSPCKSPGGRPKSAAARSSPARPVRPKPAHSGARMGARGTSRGKEEGRMASRRGEWQPLS